VPPSWIVIGLAFGDEGKGTIVDALVRKTGASTVVRFNGGCQAAHNVVTADGRHHTFSQWGSGTFAGAWTVLSNHVIVDPLAMVEEGKHLEELGIRDPLSLLWIDEGALVTTLYHATMNCIREEMRGDQRHGTCGVGIGEAVGDSLQHPETVLRAGDLRDYDTLTWKLRALRLAKAAELARVPTALRSFADGGRFEDERLQTLVADRLFAVGRRLRISKADEILALVSRSKCVFEGAQGVLLDEWYGFHPHTTWSTTTGRNAWEILQQAGVGTSEVVTVGVTRTYATRHGAGPFPSEIPGHPAPDGEHNRDFGPQGRFRVGGFDALLARYAVNAAHPIQKLAITCCDHPVLPTCIAYDGSEMGFPPCRKLSPFHEPNLERQEFRGRMLMKSKAITEYGWSPTRIARELGVPLLVESHGPRAEDKLWLEKG
jgi:adenylosuccinate synthase